VTLGGVPADLTTIVHSDTESPSQATATSPSSSRRSEWHCRVAVTTFSGTSPPFPPFTTLLCQ